ncbi:MAG: gliding motility-associated C-terminal domain-containing protein [Spirochaetota bacterium]|nr:gliding motility-associated C-terminal domain-containing protein [Spirochaetota bacterium]
MKNILSKLLTFILSITFLLIIPYYITAQRSSVSESTKEGVNREQKRKTTYKNYIWIEGEDAVATNFSKEKVYNFFCSDRFTLQLSKDTDPSSEKGYYATYVFYISRSKEYDFWMGCSPPGSLESDKPGYASPFEWKIDDGALRKASSENIYTKEFYAPGSYYWVKISSGKLDVGRHTLTIRVNQKRSSGWDYYFYIDAICFIPTYSKYLIPLMQFPEAAPDDFNEIGKGIKFEKIDFYKKKIKKNPFDKQSIFDLIQIYIWLYDYGKAINLCENYLKLKPTEIKIRFLLASALAWSGRLDDSIKEYKNIISIQKNNITARKLLAVLAGWNNRYNEAIRNYQEIISIDPYNIDAYISLATQYSWKGDVNSALEIFEKAESIAPDNIKVLYALGDNYSWSGKSYEAIRQYTKIININEKEIDAYKKLARIYLATGNKKLADETLKEARHIMQLYPEVSGFTLDVDNEMDKDRKATIDEYKKALIRNPDNLEIRKNLIDTYIWNKMDDEAVKEYNNLFNVKVVNEIDKADEKISTLALETIKFQMISPYIGNIIKNIKVIKDLYNEVGVLIDKGEHVPKELNNIKIKNDLLLLKNIAGKISLLEQDLIQFNTVISYYDKDVQSYITQRDALNWEIDVDAILSQASLSKNNNPEDFRPRKVIGVIEYLYGSTETASNELEYVYKKRKSKAYPVYLLSLSADSRFKDARSAINSIMKDKLFKGIAETNVKKLEELISQLSTSKIQQDNMSSLSNDITTLVKRINKLAGDVWKRISELTKEKEEKLQIAQNTIRYLYEKILLDMENSNVPIYSEIATYNLNRDQMSKALEYYGKILNVQPLNVEVNYKIGNLNEVSGYWKSAMDNYEICINNQPDNDKARSSHYELQRKHSPVLNSYSEVYNDKSVTRIKETLGFEYPLNNWLTLTTGYRFMNIDDEGGVIIEGDLFYPSQGVVQDHSIYAGTSFSIHPWETRFYLACTGHYYKGSVDFEISESAPPAEEGMEWTTIQHKVKSDINYSTFNYEFGFDFMPSDIGLTLKLAYKFEDYADFSRSFRLKFDDEAVSAYADPIKESLKDNYKEEITSQTLQTSLDLSFRKIHFPFSDRLFFYSSFIYRLLSDDNIRRSSFNQLTFRLLRFPALGIELDLNAVYSYEGSKFTQYNPEDASIDNEVVSIPYWSPEDIKTFSGGASWRQLIGNVLKGQFSYEVSYQYGKDNVEYRGEKSNQTNYTAGIIIRQMWDKLNLFVNYYYSNSIASATEVNAKPEPFKSHNIGFGIEGRLFDVYSPSGLGTASIVLASAYPKIITADGDGKDDFTIFSLTAFDEKGIIRWELELFNQKGTKVKSFGREGAPPATVKWDGTDKAYNPLPSEVYYYTLSIINTANERSVSKKDVIFLSNKKRAVTLETSYPIFSPNDDGIKDTISIELKATDKEKIKSWVLNIIKPYKKVVENKSSKKRRSKKKLKERVVRSIRGYEFLPYDVQWDGKDKDGKKLVDDEYLIYIKVTYKDKSVIISPKIKTLITTSISANINLNIDKFIPPKDKLIITPESADRELESWKISIYSFDKRLIKLFHGSRALPKELFWNGTDEKGNIIGYNMPVNIVLEVIDRAGNKGVSDEAVSWFGFMKKEVKGKPVITLFDQGILHERKKKNFTNKGEQVILRLLKEVENIRNVNGIRVVAHTSSDGTEKMNLDLSKERARQLGLRIKKKLNVETGFITVRGIGESVPYIKDSPSKWDARYEIEFK